MGLKFLHCLYNSLGEDPQRLQADLVVDLKPRIQASTSILISFIFYIELIKARISTVVGHN